MAIRALPYIHKIGYTGDADNFSYQSSPAYVVTFIRWTNRDTINYKGDDNRTRSPLVVINDAISIKINDEKRSPMSSCDILLKAGDINYAAAVAPGDYVLVNIVNDTQKALDIAERAKTGRRPINKFDDGFKGLFKVQSVRRIVNTNPNTGHKSYNFVINALAFTELTSLIYYNPIVSLSLQKNPQYFLSQFKDFWASFATSYKNDNNVQNVLRVLIKTLLSIGLNKSDQSIPPTQNSYFLVPPVLGRLLNRPKAKRITDIYNFVLGIWKNKNVSGNLTPGKGFNPSIANYRSDTSFFEVKGGDDAKLQGWKIYAFEDFNQKTIWSIINAYLNAAINEAYTTFRVGPDNYVYPTVILRQKPFSSLHFNSKPKAKGEKKVDPNNIPHTKFLYLPRWKIHPKLIYSIDLGKDNAARINFVQMFGRSVAVNEVISQGIQAANIFYDPEDIKKHGLRPAILTANFDFPNLSNAKSGKFKTQDWAYLMFDMLNAGHLRESGVMATVGIQDPICVGDNLDFDDNVYHIEQVQHQVSVNEETGFKQFRTLLKLSFGTSKFSTKQVPVYPQMDTITGLEERVRDTASEDILPGFGDVQDAIGRFKGEKTKEVKSAGFTKAPVNTPARERPSKVKGIFEDDRDGNKGNIP